MLHAEALAVDLRLPACRSLKDKRVIVRHLVDRSRARYGVAAAEVGRLDQRQRALLGFAAVGGSHGHVDGVLDAVERFVWSHPEVEVLSTERSWLEPDG